MYDGELPGALRGSFMTLAKFHRSATQHDASHLGLGDFILLRENKTLTCLQDLRCTFGGRGVSQISSGSATLANHAVVAKENSMTEMPVGVENHPSFPPLHMGCINRFRVLSLKASGTLTVL
jgi:hypothetical protein